MHVDEFEIDEELVRHCLATDFPKWANEPLAPLAACGTDNVIFRAGTDMLIRMPRRASAAKQTLKEQKWLPKLAAHLPLDVPNILGAGTPNNRYPWHWSVNAWLSGDTVHENMDLDFDDITNRLTQFIRALQAINADEGPRPGQHNFGRGVPLAQRDAETRKGLESLGGSIDISSALEIWTDALSAPVWIEAPVWIHGDLQASNLIVRNGSLDGVIDFGGLAVGDPACDLMIAWSLLPTQARDRFRTQLNINDDTWRRGRGWALSVAAIALPYYKDTNQRIADISERTLNALLTE